MSSERMIAARRRTGSGSGLLTASTAHSMSLRVLAAACARAGFAFCVLRGVLRFVGQCYDPAMAASTKGLFTRWILRMGLMDDARARSAALGFQRHLRKGKTILEFTYHRVVISSGGS